ncbi:PorP/SprF family type IX secretion system membrane protein [Tenacibaculum finnmarkense]|uniref:PorP/SprF family type IX secretion system membrane protein n=1 Tax=Tenacibaculum finnmarkense TaxID=2781243 RepID=UPI001E287498|nr:PorP/SprF family type IX secretion system membrane protein [Tenacibaculum finnmarkense]MCD8412872.1 PorP/SprF family type IX secretion system membrane protein [Tenacibaculum finnmarkense genomovar ulcerans]
MKKTTIIFGFLLLILGSIHNLSGQNTADFSVFNHSLNIINPAFTGKNNKTQIATNYKKVWAGIENSIHSNIVSFSMPTQKGIGIGVSIINDRFYLYNQTNIAADISSKVKLDANHELLFGLKASVNFFGINLKNLNTFQSNDPLFMQNEQLISPNFSVGFALRNERYFVHAALLDVLKERKNTTSANTLNAMRVNFGAGIYHQLNPVLGLTNTALFRATKGAPLSIDITSMFSVNNKYDIGLTYRYNAALMTNFLIKTTDWLQLGYSYGIPTNEIATYNNGTHEFFIRIYFNTKINNRFKWRLGCF